MAAIRQQQFLGQSRVDAPHLRSLESGVARDFDVLAGQILAGGQPEVVREFSILETGAVGNDAEALVMRTAGGLLIHFNASTSGSLLQIPDDRVNEVLAPTNAKVTGSFTPNTTNYVGLDITRLVDDSTADTVMFLNPSIDQEMPKLVPLARTADYQIVISTIEFSATPGLCPVAKVVTDSANKVTDLIDARNILGRLGIGGSIPSSVSPYGWPGGRTEATANGGDRSIRSVKEWMDAVMTRMWEIGGGEYWFSLTADRNVRMTTAGSPFVSNGEYFEWDGTNLHWKGLGFVFDNSTGSTNTIADQITSFSGLTDLIDGECLYIDLDRTNDATGLLAAKGQTQSLGGSARPGQRWVLAWRTGTEIHIRDQSYPVGSSFKLATTAAAGNSKVTYDTGDPVATSFNPANEVSVTGGISRLISEAGVLAAGDLLIGLGAAEGDENIVITTDGGAFATRIQGTNNYSTAQRASTEFYNAHNADVNEADVITEFIANVDGVDEVAISVESIGVLGMRISHVEPNTPVVGVNKTVAFKFWSRSVGTTPTKVDQLLIKDRNGNSSVIWTSSPY